MRHQSLTFIKEFMNKWGTPRDTLDVGSLLVEGEQTSPRSMFETYTGIDMRQGPNVDIVVNGHDLVKEFGEESFDCVLTLDTLEHDEKFWLTVEQMKKVLRPGGWMIIGVPGRRAPLHDHPADYWRFMPASMDTLFEGFESYYKEVERESLEIEDEIYAYGRKPQ